MNNLIHQFFSICPLVLISDSTMHKKQFLIFKKKYINRKRE